MIRYGVAIALFVASPAWAGTRASYTGDSDPKDLMVEVSDDGAAARVHVPGRDDYGLLLGDQFYMVGMQNGHLQVARVADLAAAFDKVMPPVFKSLFGAITSAIKPKPLRATRGGNATVAGYAGEVWQVKGLNDEKPDEATAITVSHDPALAPVGHALGAFFENGMVMMRPLLGDATAEIVAQNRQLFALGTPLDSPGRFTLQKVETVPLPAAGFALPAKPATVDELVRQLKISMKPAE